MFLPTSNEHQMSNPPKTGRFGRLAVMACQLIDDEPPAGVVEHVTFVALCRMVRVRRCPARL
ncbi:hypothetical protein OHA72_27620 [Dactylosporangium sp. NBC_01737]|uniref:hypothetical protein n=1 Tax=Dactylosporangium sp. NBC_01737 TaxID=2975959 RepID=UPI002E0E2ADF|nr:hypothetical protein OHA72_27620 [Dactylosporangium sp. NBC_01737]